MAFAPIRNRMKLTTGAKNDAWRVSLPKDACRHLEWQPGDTIEITVGKLSLLLKKV